LNGKDKTIELIAKRYKYSLLIEFGLKSTKIVKKSFKKAQNSIRDAKFFFF